MFKKITLPNGLRLLAVPKEGSESVTVLVLFGTGSKYETKNINGVSHFLEHMFFKGTEKRPDTQAVSEVLDRIGGAYNAFTGKETTGYWAKVAAENWEVAVDWVSDILLNSKFEAKEIEKEKGVIMEEINMYLDDPRSYVGEIWEDLLYGDQPAGWDTIGTKEVVAKLTRPQFIRYLGEHYRSRSAIICLAGKLPPEKELKRKIGRYFQAIKKGKGKDKLSVKEKQEKPKSLIRFKDTDQTHLCLGVRAYGLSHPDRYALTLLATMLGGMMSSRLWISVREKNGLAYYVRTSFEKYTDSGYLVTQAGVANNRAKEAISTILAEYRKIRDEKVKADEIKKAKDCLKGSTKLYLETSDHLAGWVGEQEILQDRVLTPAQVIAKIEAVTAEDLQRVARDIFRPEKINLALIGPFKEKEKFEGLLKI
ncbi:MAG: pitrilysin family protein [Candidatus Portnoybacteria bacterium]|jgi:predicted Zn-dependent peptidase|nr:pitrilysin family protein [Candidatus Portnoybacteria bacterium]